MFKINKNKFLNRKLLMEIPLMEMPSQWFAIPLHSSKVDSLEIGSSQVASLNIVKRPLALIFVKQKALTARRQCL